MTLRGLDSVALYGLVVFYGLTKDELKGRRPLAKFLCIKLIVMATFYQTFLVRFLHFVRPRHETSFVSSYICLQKESLKVKPACCDR